MVCALSVRKLLAVMVCVLCHDVCSLSYSNLNEMREKSPGNNNNNQPNRTEYCCVVVVVTLPPHSCVASAAAAVV